MKKEVKPVILCILLIVSMNLVSAEVVQFNGTVTDEEGNPLNGAAVNLTAKDIRGWTTVGDNSTTTNSTGQFNIEVDTGPEIMAMFTTMYIPSATSYNPIYGNAIYQSKSLPALSYMELQMLTGINLYLTPAGTINITAVNGTGSPRQIKYQVKDTKLGYPIAEGFTSLCDEAVVTVPRNRNYSIMIYPVQSLPVSFDWSNFSSSESYTFSEISDYNATTYTLTKIFNLTMSEPSVPGYINFSGIDGWDEFTVVPYLLEPGNMVHAQYGAMPHNLSAFKGGDASDFYDLTTGFFNITLPATVESSTIILYAAARNGTRYVGGFRNISLNYDDYPNGGDLLSVTFNFTQVYDLFGSEENITLNEASGGLFNVTTYKQTFNVVDSSNITLGNLSAHVEVKVDYSNYGAIEFTWMNDIAQSQDPTNFAVPLINETGVKEINVFASGGGGGDSGNGQYAPKTSSFTVDQVNTNSNITLKMFNPGDIDGAVSTGQIDIELYMSNSTCDVPNPPTGCSLGGPKNMNGSDPGSGFNPMKAVMGGGKISFRMGTGNITVHYVNVDMMASGPPDASFDQSTTNTTTANSFDAAARFGSGGPSIYDYVLISFPYVEGSTTQSGLNENADVNMTIPAFYDENWNVVWNATENGTSAEAFSANYSHYSTYSSNWATLMGQTNCTAEVTEFNATNPCYIDSTNNKIWIRLPHFSGTGPQVTGDGTTSTPPTTPSSGGGGGTSTSTSGGLYIDTSEGITLELQVGDRAVFVTKGTEHTITTTQVVLDHVTFEIQSTPIIVVVPAGETKEVDLNSDGVNDLAITVKSVNIRYGTAEVYIRDIETPTAVPIPTGDVIQQVEQPEEQPKTQEEQQTTEEKSSMIQTVLGVAIILAAILLASYLFFKRKTKA